MTKKYEMTEDDLNTILEACKPVPYLVANGSAPRSPQENANAAWADLGRKMGFDPMTVRPTGQGNRFFYAEPTVRTFIDGNMWCAVRLDFIDLQQSPAGFGETVELAIADLATREGGAA